MHREPAFDESADLIELSRSPVLVVCAGAKSILDLPATWERLETLGVPVVGYGTDELPGFFTRETGIRLDANATTATEVADAFLAHRALGRRSAFLVVRPPPEELALDRRELDRAIERALVRARGESIRGGAVTPFLLAEVERETGGRSLAVNLALLEGNARLAAEIAAALRARDGTTEPAPSGPRTAAREMRLVAGEG